MEYVAILFLVICLNSVLSKQHGSTVLPCTFSKGFSWSYWEGTKWYRSVVAYRKTHHFLIIFDFDIIFLRQNSCLSQNGWHHSICLALLHQNPFPPFHFKPIIDHLACIEVKGMKWSLFDHFCTPPSTVGYVLYRQNHKSHPSSGKKRILRCLSPLIMRISSVNRRHPPVHRGTLVHCQQSPVLLMDGSLWALQ